MFKKVAFTMFAVEDSTRARAFYESKLGFKRGSGSSDGVWTEYDLPGGGCLALFKHPDPAQRQHGSAGASIAPGAYCKAMLQPNERMAPVMTYMGRTGLDAQKGAEILSSAVGGYAPAVA